MKPIFIALPLFLTTALSANDQPANNPVAVREASIDGNHAMIRGQDGGVCESCDLTKRVFRRAKEHEHHHDGNRKEKTETSRTKTAKKTPGATRTRTRTRTSRTGSRTEKEKTCTGTETGKPEKTGTGKKDDKHKGGKGHKQ